MAESSSRVLGLSGLPEQHWRNILHGKRFNNSKWLGWSDADSIPAAAAVALLLRACCTAAEHARNQEGQVAGAAERVVTRT